MTSLSKIIRSGETMEKKTGTVQIKIRDVFAKQFEADSNAGEKEQSVSLEEVYKERERILEEMKREIQSKREEFEKYRQSKLEEIETLKQQWGEEKLILQKEAYDEGFQQGYEEGMKKAAADMENALNLANETIENARINAQKYLEEQEQVILELALKSAEKIIGAALKKDETLFLSIVRRGLKEARESKEIKLYVSPAYYQLVTENREELAVMFPPDVPFLIFVNEDMDDTDGYIETNHGRIVLSIDEQLKELRLKLSEMLESRD
ncbi:flagellar assembly protein FliH [Ureibacillus sp. FSL K6-8385]|uniref:flagellar assembly protein FliH n=1 Tax=Ureibacillus TaxID=160795 RepID=UPI0015EE44F4|nr:flagellar assembly protein FliH [Ureibacillus terrenus]